MNRHHPLPFLRPFRKRPPEDRRDQGHEGAGSPAQGFAPFGQGQVRLARASDAGGPWWSAPCVRSGDTAAAALKTAALLQELLDHAQRDLKAHLLITITNNAPHGTLLTIDDGLVYR